MLRRLIIVLATVTVVGSAVLSAPAFAFPHPHLGGFHPGGFRGLHGGGLGRFHPGRLAGFRPSHLSGFRPRRFAAAGGYANGAAAGAYGSNSSAYGGAVGGYGSYPSYPLVYGYANNYCNSSSCPSYGYYGYPAGGGVIAGGSSGVIGALAASALRGDSAEGP